MNKYLILSFQNAGLVVNHKDSKDKIYDVRGKRDRKNEADFVEPITVYQISNMLHVLLGERPSPSYRHTYYSSCNSIYNMANDSYIRIDSITNTKGEYITETFKSQKAQNNSWNPVSYVNWERIRKLLEDDIYNEFILALNDIFKINVLDKKFMDIRERIRNTKDSRIDSLFKYYKENGKNVMCDIMYCNVYESRYASINMNKRTPLTVLSGVEKKAKLSGKIIVPISDEFIEKLKSNKGCATILDDGIVIIEGLKTSNQININGFKLVNSISTQKTKS